MISFSNLGKYGRLGNQLFQYALVKSVSLKLGYEFGLPDLTNCHWHGQNCVLPELNLNYLPLDRQLKNIYIEKTPNAYDPDVFKVSDETNFFGHFQHPSFFIDHKNILIEEFSLKNKDIVNNCKSYLSQFTNPTSIQVRLGDYYHDNHCHQNYLNLFKNYVSECVERLPKNTDFLVFTGGSRLGNDHRFSDFEICKQLFKDFNFTYVENNSELVDFELIKNCKNTIMGWDSTFGWWASFLNIDGNVFCTYKYQKLYLEKLDNWILI